MNVLILGLGQYPKGSGVAAALHFAKAGDSVIATDLKTRKQLVENVKQLSRFKNVKFHLGEHRPEDVRWADVVVRNPRVRIESPEMKLAGKLGKRITSDLALFLEACPCSVIGITGTRGKSTTTMMIDEILSSSRQWKKVWLGGNILISPLTFLSEVKKDDLVVLEMSSWQLEGTGDAGISPHIAVWTNLMRDHLNSYPSMIEYAEAKAQIFRHQDADDVVFFPTEKSFDEYAKEAPGNVVRVKKGRFSLLVPGEHNQRNASFAAAVAKELGVSSTKIRSTLKAFKGLPNRIETVAKKSGLTFVNDTTATTPDGTMAALKAFPKTVHLIFGGTDKELEFDEITKYFASRKDVKIYLLPGNVDKKILPLFKCYRIPFVSVSNFADAFREIKARAKKGDVVLLSPGATSFEHYKNEFHRGEEFVKLVKKWK